jgi:hypothetical protein
MTDDTTSGAGAGNGTQGQGGEGQGNLPPNSGGGAANWFDGADAETVGYLQNRGLDKLDAKGAALKAIESHRNAEKLLGGSADSLVRLPKDINDTVTRDALWTKLGRPATADKYDFASMGDPVKDADAITQFSSIVGPIFHKYGLSQEQAAGVARSMAEANANVVKGQADALAIERQNAQGELQKAWGQQTAANVQAAGQAAERLGIDGPKLEAIQQAIGYVDTMRFFHGIATKIGEDSFIKSPFTNRGFTPEGARERYASLKSDSVFTSRLMKGDFEAMKEMENLAKLGWPEGGVAQ